MLMSANTFEATSNPGSDPSGVTRKPVVMRGWEGGRRGGVMPYLLTSRQTTMIMIRRYKPGAKSGNHGARRHG